VELLERGVRLGISCAFLEDLLRDCVDSVRPFHLHRDDASGGKLRNDLHRVGGATLAIPGLHRGLVLRRPSPNALPAASINAHAREMHNGRIATGHVLSRDRSQQN
jgi:hypothetical protein